MIVYQKAEASRYYARERDYEEHVSSNAVPNRLVQEGREREWQLNDIFRFFFF